MAFFDILKNKSTQAAQVAGAKAANNFGQAAKQTAGGSGAGWRRDHYRRGAAHRTFGKSQLPGVGLSGYAAEF